MPWSPLSFRRGRRLVAALVLGALIASCGDSTEPRSAADLAPVAVEAVPEAAPVLPVTLTDDFGRDVEVQSVERIIPVDGDLAEIVFALGLGDRVVATDLSATYPPEADARPEIGYQRSLLAEPILSFSPTLVLATDAAGPREVVEQIAELVPTVYVVAPDDLGGPAAKIRAVAEALGVPGRGEELARRHKPRSMLRSRPCLRIAKSSASQPSTSEAIACSRSSVRAVACTRCSTQSASSTSASCWASTTTSR